MHHAHPYGLNGRDRICDRTQYLPTQYGRKRYSLILCVTGHTVEPRGTLVEIKAALVTMPVLVLPN